MKNNLIKLLISIALFQHIKAECKTDYILEINPLLLINQGIGINAERSLFNEYSAGLNLEYFMQNPYNTNGVSANRYIYTLAPFMRYYFLTDKMFGPFLGTKLNITYSQSIISDSNTSAQSNVFFIAPIIQAGYRFISEIGFTLSAYIGIGFKSKNNSFDTNEFPSSKLDNQDWKNANEKLNKDVSQIQPDYGSTLGFIF